MDCPSCGHEMIYDEDNGTFFCIEEHCDNCCPEEFLPDVFLEGVS